MAPRTLLTAVLAGLLLASAVPAQALEPDDLGGPAGPRTIDELIPGATGTEPHDDPTSGPEELAEHLAEDLVTNLATSDDGGDVGDDGGAVGSDEAAARLKAAAGWPLAARVAATPAPRGDFRVVGGGWGHSVGLSQYGARAQALDGRSASRILGHYYPGTQVADRSASGPVRVGLSSGAASSTVTVREGQAAWRCLSGCTMSETPAPAGSSWVVRPRSGGGFTLQRSGGATITVTGGSNAVLTLDHHGTGVVEGPNPVSTRAAYRHGRTEFQLRGNAVVTVQVVPNLELYLRGLAEMPSSWPAAALQAQAIVGRTYAQRALTRNPAQRDCRCHLVASPADQAYTGWNKENETTYGTRWVQAVQATANRVVLHQGALAETYYSSSHGGRSEHVEDSWAYGTTAVPYLRSVDDPWSISAAAANPRANWSATVGMPTIRPLLPVSLARITRVVVVDRTAGGTPRRLQITGVASNGARHSFTWPTSGKPAGARLRTAAGSTVLPSQQLRSIGISPFLDAHGHPHEEGIAFAAAASITTGTTATTYRPAGAVTRAQMASFLDRTFDLPTGSPDRFQDVAGNRHAEAIGALAASDITEGCTATRYCPDAPVTRAQMASMLARAMGLRERTSPFTDVTGGPHAGNVGALAARGITAGCTPTTFCPTDAISRAQMATLLYRMVEDVR